MKKTLRGFTFIEVLLYIGLFSLLGTAMLTFAWDIIELSERGKTERLITEEGRLALVRIESLIRDSAGVDESASTWDDADGILVLNEFGSSDTVTLYRQNGQIMMRQSGHDPIALQSRNVQVSSLFFRNFSSADKSGMYIDIAVTVETLPTLPHQYSSSLTLQTGVTSRNLGL